MHYESVGVPGEMVFRGHEGVILALSMAALKKPKVPFLCQF